MSGEDVLGAATMELPREEIWSEDEEYDASNSGDSESVYSIDEAQEQWEESVDQLQKLCTLILLPLAGKFMGRKFAYYLWAKYVAYQNSL